MAKNDYLRQRDEIRKQFFIAGCDLVQQQMFDMMCLVLNDPEIMGHDTFGADRLRKIHKAMFAKEAEYHEAWTFTQESDYFQEKLDDALRDIFGEIQPFNERYPNQKQWDYKKVIKK